MKDVEKLHVRDLAGGSAVAVKVVPGASRDRIVGVLGDSLKITTSAPPEKGKANAAVAGTLAKALGLSSRDLSVLAGRGAARKEFLVAGLSAGEVRRRLAGG